ncbi:MAG: hypothetical protein PWP08_1779 [Methanofollis sp.]|nr:hypothetical protein [Methanofollis sp.]
MTVIVMECGKMLGDSYGYTRDGLWGNWGKWVLLFISMIIFPLWGGFQWKIYKGESQLPSLEGWVEMFVNGIKLIIVGFVYGLIPFIVSMVVGGAGDLASGGSDAASAAMLVGMIISLIISFLFSLIAMMALIRFARTNSFGEAFNFSAIVAHIGKIGWLNYILALIILWIVLLVAVMLFIIVVGIISVALALIPVVGRIIALILIAIVAILIGPFVGVFEARYLTTIYDSVEA